MVGSVQNKPRHSSVSKNSSCKCDSKTDQSPVRGVVKTAAALSLLAAPAAGLAAYHMTKKKAKPPVSTVKAVGQKILQGVNGIANVGNKIGGLATVGFTAALMAMPFVGGSLTGGGGFGGSITGGVGHNRSVGYGLAGGVASISPEAVRSFAGMA